jgi:hypothetical protein
MSLPSLDSSARSAGSFLSVKHRGGVLMSAMSEFLEKIQSEVAKGQYNGAPDETKELILSKGGEKVVTG